MASSKTAMSVGRKKGEVREFVAPPNSPWLGLTMTSGGGGAWTRLEGRVLLMLSQKYSSSLSVVVCACVHKLYY